MSSPRCTKQGTMSPDAQPQPTPLGRRLREQRQARGWSQAEFSERSGINPGMVSLIEQGKRGQRPGRDLVLKIAKAFNEPEDWWLDLTRFASDHDVVDYRPTFREFVEADPYLTSDQKQALITSYIGFVSARRRSRRQMAVLEREQGSPVDE